MCGCVRRRKFWLWLTLKVPVAFFEPLTAVSEPRPKISPRFSHLGHLSSGTALNAQCKKEPCHLSSKLQLFSLWKSPFLASSSCFCRLFQFILAHSLMCLTSAAFKCYIRLLETSRIMRSQALVCGPLNDLRRLSEVPSYRVLLRIADTRRSS